VADASFSPGYVCVAHAYEPIRTSLQFHAYLKTAQNAAKNMSRTTFMFFIEFMVWRYNQRKLELFEAQDAEAARQSSLRSTEAECDEFQARQRHQVLA
jgi:hypothetical protein